MEKALRILAIDAEELYFSAAHYLPDYEGLCAHLHGHTYYVKHLRVSVRGFVDLGDIKKAVKSMDHMYLIPECHSIEWGDLLDVINKEERFAPIRKVFARRKMIIDTDVPGTTVERIAEELRKTLENIPGVEDVHFILYEGPIAGREL